MLKTRYIGIEYSKMLMFVPELVIIAKNYLLENLKLRKSGFSNLHIFYFHCFKFFQDPKNMLYFTILLIFYFYVHLFEIYCQ